MQPSVNRLPLQPELVGQVPGYWFGPGERVPPRPEGQPTGAVLPAVGTAFPAATIICLDLVPVQNYWIVLSELGRYTYRHTSGLLLDERWIFVPISEIGGSWPVEYTVKYEPGLPVDQIAARFGPEAATRARPDARAVRLRLQRKRARLQ